jgi:hypothetical protein
MSHNKERKKIALYMKKSLYQVSAKRPIYMSVFGDTKVITYV